MKRVRGRGAPATKDLKLHQGANYDLDFPKDILSASKGLSACVRGGPFALGRCVLTPLLDPRGEARADDLWGLSQFARRFAAGEEDRGL